MSLEAIPLSGAMGAEVRGADLREVDDDTFAEIHNILLNHGMIFFAIKTLPQHSNWHWRSAGASRIYTPICPACPNILRLSR